jgi:hypothetical protein
MPACKVEKRGSLKKNDDSRVIDSVSPQSQFPVWKPGMII